MIKSRTPSTETSGGGGGQTPPLASTHGGRDTGVPPTLCSNCEFFKHALERAGPDRLLHDRSTPFKSGKSQQQDGPDRATSGQKPASRLALVAAAKGIQARPHDAETIASSRAQVPQNLGRASCSTERTKGIEGRDRQAEELREDSRRPHPPASSLIPANPAIHRKTTAEKSGTTPTARWTSSFPDRHRRTIKGVARGCSSPAKAALKVVRGRGRTRPRLASRADSRASTHCRA